MAQYALYMQPALGDLTEIDIPAPVLRQQFTALAGPGGDGIIAPVSAVVTHRAAGANLSVDIQPFYGICQGDDMTDQGSYLIINTAVLNVAGFVSPPSGTRLHRLVAQIKDHRAQGTWPGGLYTWEAVPVLSTSASLPDRPPSSLDLSSVAIAAGQSAIQDTNLAMLYTVLRDLNIRGPWFSYQSGVGAWNTTGSWVAYGPSNWPAVPFTVPPSGKVYVTIHAGVIGASTAAVGFGISGVDSVSPTFGRCVSAGTVAVRASNRSIVTGLTPGASDTATAFWYANGAGCSDTVDGHLLVEAVQ